jgi:acetyl esterase/lipase
VKWLFVSSVEEVVQMMTQKQVKRVVLLILTALATGAIVFFKSKSNTLEERAGEVRTGAVPLYESSSAEAALPEQWFGDTEHGIAVRNVTRPTVTPFLPDKSKATGAGVLVVPGGGFYYVDVSNEGVPVAQWLANHGIAAFLVKYRTVATPRDQAAFVSVAAPKFAGFTRGSGAKELPGEVTAREDVQQALRVVLHRAAEWQVDPRRVGLLGFSAGAIASLNVTLANAQGAQPAFAGLLYGRMLSVSPPPEAPPLFVARAADDPFFQGEGLGLVESWRGAGRSVEFHLYDRGGHGFGMKHQGTTSDHWIEDFYRWLGEFGFLKSDQDARTDRVPSN